MNVTFRQTVFNMHADYNRRLLLEEHQGNFAKLFLLFRRGMTSVFVYRLSRYFVLNNLTIFARILIGMNKIYTKNVISPLADIGPGFVMADNGGIGLTHVLIAGKNCTFLGCSAVTLGAIPSHDSPEKRIVLGDYCVLGVRAKVIRPVHLANGTQIQFNSIVLRSHSAIGSVLSGIPARRSGVAPYEKVMQWNSLYGGYNFENQQNRQSI